MIVFATHVAKIERVFEVTVNQKPIQLTLDILFLRGKILAEKQTNTTKKNLTKKDVTVFLRSDRYVFCKLLIITSRATLFFKVADSI